METHHPANHLAADVALNQVATAVAWQIAAVVDDLTD